MKRKLASALSSIVLAAAPLLALTWTVDTGHDLKYWSDYSYEGYTLSNDGEYMSAECHLDIVGGGAFFYWSATGTNRTSGYQQFDSGYAWDTMASTSIPSISANEWSDAQCQVEEDQLGSNSWVSATSS